MRTFKRALSLSYVTYSYIHLYINCPVMFVQVTVTHMRCFLRPMPEVTTTTPSFCFTWLGPPCPRVSLVHITYVCPSRGSSFSCLDMCARFSFIPWHVTQDLSHSKEIKDDKEYSHLCNLSFNHKCFIKRDFYFLKSHAKK